MNERTVQPPPSTITIGNCQGLSINSIGSSASKFPLKHNPNLVLNNILYVPIISKNLPSVGRFPKITRFTSSFILIRVVKSQDSNETYRKRRPLQVQQLAAQTFDTFQLLFKFCYFLCSMASRSHAPASQTGSDRVRVGLVKPTSPTMTWLGNGIL